MSWTYAATKNGYAKMWDSITIKASDAKTTQRFAKKIIAGKSRYMEVQNVLGIPWYFVGALHMRESSCDFAGCLHNGEKIIGTRRKTKLVPKGRGPFATWQASAIDALTMHNLRGIAWCPARMAYESEIYNGTGYTTKGVNSPYVWAGSNHEQAGKYVADGKFDRKADDVQIGTMTVLKALAGIDPEIAASLAENHKSPMSNTKKTVIGTVAAGAVGTATVATNVAPVATTVQDTVPDAANTVSTLSPIIDMLQNHGGTIALAFTVAVVVGAVFWHFYEKHNAEAGA